MQWLPTVVGAEYGGEYRITITFNDGTRSTVDFRPWLQGPIFEPLQDTDYFRRFFLEGGDGCLAERGGHCAGDALRTSQGERSRLTAEWSRRATDAERAQLIRNVRNVRRHCRASVTVV